MDRNLLDTCSQVLQVFVQEEGVDLVFGFISFTAYLCQLGKVCVIKIVKFAFKI